jgi:hypothetical protein
MLPDVNRDQADAWNRPPQAGFEAFESVNAK